MELAGLPIYGDAQADAWLAYVDVREKRTREHFASKGAFAWVAACILKGAAKTEPNREIGETRDGTNWKGAFYVGAGRYVLFALGDIPTGPPVFTMEGNEEAIRSYVPSGDLRGFVPGEYVRGVKLNRTKRMRDLVMYAEAAIASHYPKKYGTTPDEDQKSMTREQIAKRIGALHL